MVDEGATPVLDVLAGMTAVSVENTAFDPGLQVLLRFAALVALDAAPASYLFHLGAGAEQGLTMEDAQQVLIILAPLGGDRSDRVGEHEDRSRARPGCRRQRLCRGVGRQPPAMRRNMARNPQLPRTSARQREES